MIFRSEILKHGQFGRWSLSIALMVLALVAGCESSEKRQGSILRQIQTRGTLRVATTNAPSTYFDGRNGPAGFEHDLVDAYAQHLGVTPEFLVFPTVEAVLQAVEDDQVDLAAAGLTVTDERKEHVRFGPAYLQAAPVLVCRRGVRPIKDLGDMIGIQFELAAGSSFIEVVADLRPQTPGLRQPVISGNSVETLLADVASDRIDCTMADDHVFALHRRYMPMLEARLSVGEGAPLAWALGGGHSWANASLIRDLEHWWAGQDTRELISRLDQRYFAVGNAEFDYVDLSRLRRALKSRLPRYQTSFEAAGQRYELPWTLLAAIAWRESRWRPDATSHTGVRGLMMLTRVTAKEQGVSDRLDPAQSIRGGARYLASLIRRLPDSVADDQRVAFGLAAYNMGWGHMMDARALVRRRGDDPDQWSSVSAILPELENKDVYQTLQRGYARGREGQVYVAAVLNFADIIEKAHAPVIPPGVRNVAELADEKG